MKHLKLFEEFDPWAKDDFPQWKLEKRKNPWDNQSSVIDYVLRYFSIKDNFDKEDYINLKNNLKEYWIWREGGLKEIVKRICINNKRNYNEILKRYKNIYNDWENDEDWWQWVVDNGDENDDNWENYDEMEEFINGRF